MLEMPDLIREWKKVSTPFGAILPPFSNQASNNLHLGWKAELGEVSQKCIMIAPWDRVQALLRIDCITSNVQHLENNLTALCSRARQLARLLSRDKRLSALCLIWPSLSWPPPGPQFCHRAHLVRALQKAPLTARTQT
jgi:hypothetical protein